jgi:hypothetical protein
VTYRTLQRQFQLEADALTDLLGELRYAYRDAIREDEQGIAWTDDAHPTPPATATPAEQAARAPLTYTPAYLAEKILTSRSALEGERTQGNPFFLEESIRTLVETGALVGERGAYRLAKPLDTLQVPTTVQALLAARIDRLPPEDKRLLQTAAIIGTDVPWPLLQAIADTSDEALYRSLGQLQAAEFLYETSLFPERAYTFKHALTHEVAYGSLLHERRCALNAGHSPRGSPWPKQGSGSPRPSIFPSA